MNTTGFRYDFMPITGHEKTDEGFLRVWCRAARTGTQLYRRADGSQVREYRPPEEVGDPETLSTFGMKPVTLRHPPVLLDSTNTKDFQVGYSGSQVRFNDGFVEVALTVTDENAIRTVMSRQATEVSAGYKVDFDPTPGITPTGESYDGVQRNIRVNHIAIVPQGRAGPEVRLLLDRMDSADAIAWEGMPPQEPQPQYRGDSKMAKVRLDDIEIEVPTEVAGVIQSYVADAARTKKQIMDEMNALKEKMDGLKAEYDSMCEAKEDAAGREDAYVSIIKELEQKLEKATADVPTDRLDELLTERYNTIATLMPILGEDFKYDGISNEELYLHAYDALFPNRRDDSTDQGYIRGVVEGALVALDSIDDGDDDDEDEEGYYEEEEDDREDSTEPLRTALRSVTSRRSDSADAVSAYRQNLTTAWQK